MGRNDHGQLGTGHLNTAFTPQKSSFQKEIKKVSTGRSHSLLLTQTGEVYGCGSNSFGQLGLGDSKTAVRDVLNFVKLPLQDIVDVSAGENHSLCCDQSGYVYSFGHPEYGQLGHGSTGEYIKKSSSMSYNCQVTPKRIETFLTKDNSGKVIKTLSAEQLRICSVSAGKNHSICLEDGRTGGNRMYSWGFGGYGRLGHNCSDDELLPREVVLFTQPLASDGTAAPTAKPNPQRIIRSVEACSTFSLAVSISSTFYTWGKLSNAPKGEATIYPKQVQDLYGFQIRDYSGGANVVVVTADDRLVGWGQPAAGKLGFEGDAKGSAHPKFLSAFDGIEVLQVSCGYGHMCMLVAESDKTASLPRYPQSVEQPAVKAAVSAGKKRAAETTAGDKTKKAVKK